MAVGLILLSLLALRLYTDWGWASLETSVNALAVDGTGTIWAADKAGRVWVADGTRLRDPAGARPEVPLSTGATVTALAVDGQGRLWAGASDGAVAARDVGGTWVVYRPEAGDGGAVAEMAVDGQGRAWVRSRSELSLIEPGPGVTTYSLQMAGLAGNAADMAVDVQGRLWVVARAQVKRLGPDGEWVTYPAPVGITRLAVDGAGRVWAGRGYPNGEEVSVLGLDGAWTTYSFDDSPHTGGSVTDLAFDAHGRLWLAGIGLSRMDAGGGWITYKYGSSGLPRAAIQAVAIDREGRIWLHTWPARLVVFDAEAAPPPLSVRALLGAGAVVVAGFPLAGLALAWRLAVRRPATLRLAPLRNCTLGFLGWFVLLGLFWLVVSQVAVVVGGPGATAVFLACLFVPLLPNLSGLLLLRRKRPAIALGALAAMAVNAFAIVVLVSRVTTLSPAWLSLGLVPFYLLGAFG